MAYDYEQNALAFITFTSFNLKGRSEKELSPIFNKNELNFIKSLVDATKEKFAVLETMFGDINSFSSDFLNQTIFESKTDIDSAKGNFINDSKAYEGFVEIDNFFSIEGSKNIFNSFRGNNFEINFLPNDEKVEGVFWTKIKIINKKSEDTFEINSFINRIETNFNRSNVNFEKWNNICDNFYILVDETMNRNNDEKIKFSFKGNRPINYRKNFQNQNEFIENLIRMENKGILLTENTFNEMHLNEIWNRIAKIYTSVNNKEILALTHSYIFAVESTFVNNDEFTDDEKLNEMINQMSKTLKEYYSFEIDLDKVCDREKMKKFIEEMGKW